MKPFALLSVLSAAALVVTTTSLWRLEATNRREAAQELVSLQQNHQDLKSRYQGLERAHEEVREQLEDLRKAPPMFTLPAEFVQEDPEPDTAGPQSESENPQTASVPVSEAKAASRPFRERMTEEQWQQFETRKRERRLKNSTRVMGQVDSRLEYFRQVQTQGLSPEHLNSHQSLLENLEALNLSLRQVTADMDTSEYMESLRGASTAAVKINAAMRHEREILLHDLISSALASENPDISEMVLAIREIETMTQKVSALNGFGTR